MRPAKLQSQSDQVARFGSPRLLQRVGRWAFPLAISALLSACSSVGHVVWHSFGFDIRGAKPEVELLDYRYGTSGLPGARPARYQVEENKVGSASGVSGPMTVGADLFVKWRVKESGAVYEDTVDLRDRLPRNMEDKTLRFYIVGPQLYVYVVNFAFLPVGAPEEIHPEALIQNLPFTYHHSYQIIYPDQPEKQTNTREKT